MAKGIGMDMNWPLTGGQMHFYGGLKPVIYSNIDRHKTIDAIFDSSSTDKLALLYEAIRGQGHWILLMRNKPKNTIYFFDSYGESKPDDLIDTMSKHMYEKKHLVELMLMSDYKIDYNNHKYQRYMPSIQTCGRHCIVRSRYPQLTTDEYYQMMHFIRENTKLSYDRIVTLLTNDMRNYTCVNKSSS